MKAGTAGEWGGQGSNRRRRRHERGVDLALAIAYVAACALLGWAGALWRESSLWP